MRMYRTSEVAALLGYSDRQIRRKCNEKAIPATRMSDSAEDGYGHWRISGEWVERALKRLGRSIPGRVG